MMPLMDMMMNMQNGEAVRQLSRQFQLNQEQTRAALEALMPAFSHGLKRNTHDPLGAGNFLSALASGQHAQYFENPMAAFTPGARQEGNDILGHIFGSKTLSRAVAQQAAQATGIGQEIYKQMLPVLATMIMGGLYKQSTGQFGSGGQAAGENFITEIMEQMMKTGGATGASEQSRQSPPNPFDNPFTQALQQMMSGAGGAQASKDSGNVFAGNPFARIFEDMMKAGWPLQSEPEPQVNPSGRPRNPYDEIFGKMFESGRQARDDYQKNMETLFDLYLKGMPKA